MRDPHSRSSRAVRGLRGRRPTRLSPCLCYDQAPPERLELDLDDALPFERQLYDQILLDDPDIPGFQPALPEDFDMDALVKQVEEEAKR